MPHTTLPEGAPAVAAQDAGQCGDACRNSDVAPACQNMSDGRPKSARYPLDGTAMSAAAAAYQRQAYFACVSYTDENLGKILDAFDATPFSRDAVLIFWGDHGYQLGDNDQWAKMTNFEHATKIPLMIGCGGGEACVGRSAALVEALDIMPTVLEEAGVVPPTSLCKAVTCSK